MAERLDEKERSAPRGSLLREGERCVVVKIGVVGGIIGLGALFGSSSGSESSI